LRCIRTDLTTAAYINAPPIENWGHMWGYKSPSIIKYIEPITGDLFTAHHADCIFDEDNFPALGRDNIYQQECEEINWNASGI